MQKLALAMAIAILTAYGQASVPTATVAPKVTEQPTVVSTAIPTTRPTERSTPVATETPVATTVPEVGYPVVTVPMMNVIGIYDPHRRFDGQKSMQVEEVFLPWRLENATEVISEVHRIRLANRLPLVALEPWPFNWQGLVANTLFLDITTRRYDSSIQTVCNALGNEAPQEVWIRWGHEMELDGMFVWSQGNPNGFIGAYRHFVTTCRNSAKGNLKFVWSPAGDKALVKFWPGADYVDIVGLTVLGFKDWDLSAGAKKPNSFEDIFGAYNLVKQYNKPVLVAELGVAGDNSEYQLNWLKVAFASFAKFPLLKGVVYFNDINPRNSWSQFKTPDWRVEPSLFPPK